MFMFVRFVQAVLSPITFPPAWNALGFILTPELRPENNPFPASLKPRRTPQSCVNERKHDRWKRLTRNYLQMVTAIRTCKKGKKEWDGNNSSGGGDKREGRKDCLKKIKRGVWGGGGEKLYSSRCTQCRGIRVLQIYFKRCTETMLLSLHAEKIFLNLSLVYSETEWWAGIRMTQGGGNRQSERNSLKTEQERVREWQTERTDRDRDQKPKWHKTNNHRLEWEQRSVLDRLTDRSTCTPKHKH